MGASILLANPHVTDKLLAAAGLLAGLGTEDVREFSQRRIPVWIVAAGSVALGLGAGIYLARYLPREWVSRAQPRP